MPKRDDAPLGAPCWVDLMTSDPERSRAFYGTLFGWTSEDAGPDYGGYINFFLDGVQVAGCMQKQPEMADVPDVWSVYLATKDAQATTDAATARGGQVLVPPMDVMDLGRMGLLLDPDQASIGIWQPGLHRGFGVLDEPGAPSWFELFTRDYDTVVAFYRDVFGWDVHVQGDSPEFRYSTANDGEQQLAGVMDASNFLPEGVPAHWSVYFATADADASIAAVVDLGGSVVAAAEDTPYGRIATVADATGAMCKLRQAP